MTCSLFRQRMLHISSLVFLFQLKAKGDTKKGGLNQEKSDEEKGPLLPYDVPEGERRAGGRVG